MALAKDRNDQEIQRLLNEAVGIPWASPSHVDISVALPYRPLTQGSVNGEAHVASRPPIFGSRFKAA